MNLSNKSAADSRHFASQVPTILSFQEQKGSLVVADVTMILLSYCSWFSKTEALQIIPRYVTQTWKRVKCGKLTSRRIVEDTGLDSQRLSPAASLTTWRHYLFPVLGDPRTNQNPALLSFGILFFRWHNVVARRVQERHPDWPDEEVFQRARRYVVATLQVTHR